MAIIDAFMLGLCILALVPLVSLYTLDVRRLYSGYVFWARPLWRLPLAALLYYLRPRPTSSAEGYTAFTFLSRFGNERAAQAESLCYLWHSLSGCALGPGE